MRNRQGQGRGDPQARGGGQGIRTGVTCFTSRMGDARFRMRNLPQSRDMTGPRAPHAAAPFAAPPAFARSAMPPAPARSAAPPIPARSAATRSRSRRQQPTRSFLNAA